MPQASLLETPDYAHLAGLMSSLRAAMPPAAGAEEGEGRKATVDTINIIARAAGIHIVDERGFEDMEYGRACHMEREAKRRKRQLEDRI